MKLNYVFLLMTFIALPVSAHPGKTDGQGGHKCYKECAEWDLYYAEYHLHDKDGRPVKAARKKQVRSQPDALPVVTSAIEEKPTERPAEATSAQPAAIAVAAVVEPDTPTLTWTLLLLFLLLLLLVRRNRRKTPDAK